MIEIYKHQFKYLSAIISHIKNRNYRFIIYMDDLSFEEFEIEYKYLKAVIEGGMETKPDNVLIYATSNRRHLIRETWSDRSDKMKNCIVLIRYRRSYHWQHVWCKYQLLQTNTAGILPDCNKSCKEVSGNQVKRQRTLCRSQQMGTFAWWNLRPYRNSSLLII